MSVNVVNIYDAGDYDAQVARAVSLLREGGIVVLPTETVYGAAGLLNQSRAVARLRALRGTGSGDRPFTVHLGRREDAMQYLGEVNDLARRMMQKLWPGPVALTFDVPEQRRREIAKTTGVNEADLFANGSITLRCPDHIVAADVLQRLDGPAALTLVEPNVIDGLPTFDHLEGKADLVFDAGAQRYAKPSTIVRVGRESWEIVRAGVFDQRIIERLLRTTVLFVCSGNTCRSPMAEALARKILSDHLKVSEDQLESKGIIVMSAGTFAMPGSRATPQGVEAVKSLGADLSKHRSRPLSVELIHQADFIFAMGRGHTNAIVGLVPSAAEKTFMLDPSGDVDDPIGGDESLYRDLARTMKGLIEKRLNEQKLV